MTEPSPDQLLTTIRRFLDDLDARHHQGALDVVLENIEAVAIDAWSRAEGKPGPERLLGAIVEAAEFLEGLTVELTGDQGGAPREE
jgi:hypothetical protein